MSIVVAGLWFLYKFNVNSNYAVGQRLDSLNGVVVYYNGDIPNVVERNITADNYNLGLKYQCVEFVKRYYYEHLHHKMPDVYGNAKDFYDKKVKDGEINLRRNLTQFSNPSKSKPKVDDLLILNGTSFNSFGHVAIVSRVSDNEIEIIQQNPGKHGKPRGTFSITEKNEMWKIENNRVLGWLRKELK
jgi:surface antigen